jgi:acetyl esterase/lipase
VSEPGVRTTYRTVEGVDLPIDVFSPRQPDATSAVIFFHGGGLTSGSLDFFHPECEYLASRGIVAATAEYRLLPNQARDASDCMADAQAAVAWVRSSAGFSIETVTACGHSAGGLLAGATAFEPPLEDFGASCRPDALVLLNAVYDPGWPQKASRSGEICPAVLVLHGRRDTMTSINSARRFAKAMVAAGHPVEVAEFDGAHSFFRPYGKNGSAGLIAVLQRLDLFLTGLGHLCEDELANARIEAIGEAMLADVLARRQKRRRGRPGSPEDPEVR